MLGFEMAQNVLQTILDRSSGITIAAALVRWSSPCVRLTEWDTRYSRWAKAEALSNADRRSRRSDSAHQPTIRDVPVFSLIESGRSRLSGD
jgi:hypothetical protein